MKKIKYQLWEELSSQMFLHYNSFSNQFLLLNEKKHNHYLLDDISDLEIKEPSLYQLLLNSQFIVSDNFDEAELTFYRRKLMQFDTSMYQIMINTTLDCNLNCWYCYENRVQGSRLTDEVVEAIEKNILYEYGRIPYSTIKISFFGGEPFLYFKGIEQILNYANMFCQERNLKLIVDFTTNATLITKEQIDFLKQFECHFQIPIDGSRRIHNLIKKDKLQVADTYQQTMEALRLINEHIPNRWIAVRVNFDNRVLRDIDEIIADISFLDRKNSYVILKKVWQIPTDKVNKEMLHVAIQKFFDNKFRLDYYIMPKSCICFAERNRMTLFNYDGKVFKCSTISSFDDENALGELCFETGEVKWNENRMAYWMKDMSPDKCIQCEWYPACLGPCNKQLMAHKGKQMCTFDAMNMDRKEYLMYAFKFQLLQKEIESADK